MDLLRFFYIHRKILYSTVLQGIKARTVGNTLGLFWLVLYPLLFLTMYYLVFSAILNVRIPGLSTPGYIALIFSGLVPFLAFSEAFSLGTTSIVANRGLLKNTIFPIELVVAKDVIVAHCCVGIGLLMVIISVFFFQGWAWTFLFIPLIYLTQIFFCIGLAWITSSLNVFFRDIQQSIPILILLLMMISPIAYTADMVPEKMKAILIFNPLAYFMSLYRSALFESSVNINELAIVALMTLCVSVLGFHLISKLKVIFPDYV